MILETNSDIKVHSLTIGSVHFEWHEGAYIEVFDVGVSTPFSVINVWDYAKDTPRIPRTHNAFVKECKKFYSKLEV